MRWQTIAAACVLDVAFGDPAWLPHPVRAFGFAGARGSRTALRLARGDRRLELAYGAVLTAAIVGGTYTIARVAIDRAYAAGEGWGEALEIALAWTTIAIRDLLAEARAVDLPLGAGDLERARTRVARIVGRDTFALDASGVARATIETLAESTCDGIAAPLLALAIGGAPLALAFKAASTLDSTIGHIEAPYTYVGRVAARLDDVLCFVPARLAAVVIALASRAASGRTRRSLATWLRDGHKHASPNAGQPEAAMAGALGVRLGGLSTYDGVALAAPLLGAEFALPVRADVARARLVVGCASAILTTAAISLAAVRS